MTSTLREVFGWEFFLFRLVHKPELGRRASYRTGNSRGRAENGPLRNHTQISAPVEIGFSQGPGSLQRDWLVLNWSLALRGS